MRVLLLLLNSLFVTLLFAQSPEKNLAAFGTSFPQEKVVLQFSKPAYLAGETIHFKAYVLTGYEPSALSTNLYAELYDKDRNRLDSQIIFLSKGSGDGRFFLPASLAEDVYYIKAYTRWMLNFDNASQPIHALRVYNPYSSQSLRLKPVQWTAKAFIEGAHILDSAVTNVAVRLFSEGTLPSSWTGTLVEAEGHHPVAPVSVYNNEVGQVRFVAYRDKSYKLLLKDNLGTTQEILLPPVKTKGALLQASLYGTTLRYSILFKDLPTMGNGYKLVAAIHNQPVFAATVTKSSGGIAGAIDTKKFPPGVLQLTLFDESGQPVSERLCFLHHNALPVTVPLLTTDTLAFTARNRNHWQLESDTLGWHSYAVQVTDASLPFPNSFLSDIYLRSDFRSTIHNASWYFEDITAEKTAALDALLLTENWNGYDWQKIIRQDFPVLRYQPEQLLSVTGTVRKGPKPQANREINLLLKTVDSSLSFVQVKTDAKGNFLLQDLFFIDSLQVYYQPDKRKFLEGDITIQLMPHNRHHPLQTALPPSTYTTALREKTDTIPAIIQKALAQKQQELLLAEKIKMLQEVVVTTQAKAFTQQLDEQLSSGLFRNGHATIFDFVNTNETALLAYNNVLEWLQGRIPGFTLSRRQGDIIPFIRNQQATVFLDEIPVSAETISSVAPQEIALIKVFSGGMLGAAGTSSSIAIYTRRGGMQSRDRTPGMQRAILRGYKRYLLPTAYDYSEQNDTAVKDERMILFYHTLLQPDPSSGKAAIVFYNNDTTQQYRLLVTGFNGEGKPVFLNKVIQ